jgi:hypothetical protein
VVTDEPQSCDLHSTTDLCLFITKDESPRKKSQHPILTISEIPKILEFLPVVDQQKIFGLEKSRFVFFRYFPNPNKSRPS